MYITQEKEVHSFDSISESLKNYENWFMKPMEFEGLLSYSSYHGTGLYSYEDLKERHDWIYTKEKWDYIQKAIGISIVPDQHDMTNVQKGNINILNAVDTNELLGIVFGNYLIQFCLSCLSVLGYLAGLEFLVKKLMFLLNLFKKSGQQSQNIQINLTEKETKIGYDWQSALRTEREEFLLPDEAPPPYK